MFISESLLRVSLYETFGHREGLKHRDLQHKLSYNACIYSVHYK